MDDKWSALEKYNLWNGNSYKLGYYVHLTLIRFMLLWGINW